MDKNMDDNSESDFDNNESTIKRHQREYELISKSLKDGNCDFVINFLLSNSGIDSKTNKNHAKNSECTDGYHQLVSSTEQLASNSSRSVSSILPLSSSLSSITSSSVCSSTTTPITKNSFPIKTGDDNSTQYIATSLSSTSCATNSLNSQDSDSVSSQRAHDQKPIWKPPILPNRNSAIINLDKNRVNGRRHRSKLLPRPISLPSSFYLLKNFRTTPDSVPLDNEKIDIEFIKQLEEEIYRSRAELTVSKKCRVIPTKLHGNDETCIQCQKRDSAHAQNHLNKKRNFKDTFLFDKRDHLALLLDTWQMDPISLKFKKNDFFDFYIKDKLRRRNIDHNDTEKRKNYDNSENIKNTLKREFSKRNEHSKNLTKLFKIHLNNWNGEKETLLEQNKQRNSINLVSQPSNTVGFVDNTLPVTNTSHQSQFKRFFLQGRKLNFKLKGKRSHSKDDKTSKLITNKKNNTNFTIKSKASPIMLTAPRTNINELVNTGNHDNNNNNNTGHGLKNKRIKNLKLNWILNTKPKVNAFKQHLLMRRYSHSYNQNQMNVSNTRKTGNYTLDYCNFFSSVSWSCSDLTELNNANYLRTIYNRYKKLDQNYNESDACDSIEQHLRHNSDDPISCRQSNSVKNVKRRSSFRHSVGSATAMTDVDKTWVYRRRFIFQ